MSNGAEDCCNITTKDKIQRMKSMAALLPDGFKKEHFDNCIYIEILLTNMLDALKNPVKSKTKDSVDMAVKVIKDALDDNSDVEIMLHLKAAIECLEAAIHEIPETCDHQHNVACDEINCE